MVKNRFFDVVMIRIREFILVLALMKIEKP